MSWSWDYVFGAKPASRTAPKDFIKEVEKKAEELVRMCEVKYLNAKDYQGMDPKGQMVTVPGGMFTYQIVIRSEFVGIVQITSLNG